MRQRAGLVAFVPVVLGILLVAAGCGFDPHQAPVDAKKDDFCRAWGRLAAADASTRAADMSDYLRDFARYGTPRGIPTAARNGFEYAIDPHHEFADGRQLAALATRTDAIGKNAAALTAYANGFCGTR